MSASSGVKLVEEKLFYVFGAQAGGLAKVVDGDEVAAGLVEGGADAAEQGAGVALTFAGDVADIFRVDADAVEDEVVELRWTEQGGIFPTS